MPRKKNKKPGALSLIKKLAREAFRKINLAPKTIPDKKKYTRKKKHKKRDFEE